MPSAERAPARFAWGVLAYNLAVIVWGAYVRASGSGAGCGSHWPLCNGEVLPRAPMLATLIEFTHRLTSGVALLLVAALVVVAFRARARGHPARRAAALSLLFMLGEAAVGAGLVLFELVADNASVARALFMATHLANTFLLLLTLSLTALFLGPRLRLPPAPAHVALRRAFVAAAAGLMLVGVSGAVAALGDTLYPATSLGDPRVALLSPTARTLLRLRLAHPLAALLAAGGVVWLALRALRAPGPPPVRGWARALLLLVPVQLACGALDVLLLAPVALQLAHLLLADLVWIALVLLAASWAWGYAAPADAPARP